MAELTVDNFIRQIKSMNDREKGKLRAMDLIALIIQLPDEQSPILLVDISGKVEALINTVVISDLQNNNNELISIVLIGGMELSCATCRGCRGNIYIRICK